MHHLKSVVRGRMYTCCITFFSAYSQADLQCFLCPLSITAGKQSQDLLDISFCVLVLILKLIHSEGFIQLWICEMLNISSF